MLLTDDGLEVNSVTLFRDHLAAATFHYLPGSPQVVIEGGQAHAQLVRFRSAEHSGGFLSLDVQLGLDAPLLKSVEAELESRFGVKPNLVPVLFNQGSVRLTTLDFQQTPGRDGVTSVFVENVIGVSVPSLLGKQRAIFETKLTPEGSVLMQRALLTGAAPVLVVYDLEFSGLSPARGLRASVRYKRAYEYLRSRLGVNSLYFKTDVDNEAERMLENGLITIEDVDFVGADPAVRAKRDEEVRSTLSELMQGLFFRPSGSPAALPSMTSRSDPAMDAYWAAQGRPQAAFLMRSLNQQEHDTLTYDLTEARVVSRNVAPQGAIRLPLGTAVSTLIVDTTLDWPPPITSVRALALPDADWSGVAAVEINLRHKDQVNTIVLSQAEPERTVKLEDGPVEYNITVKAQKEPEALGNIPAADLAFRPLTSSNIVIDPSALSGRRELRLTLGAVDFTMVSKITGTLATSGGDLRSFQLDAANTEVAVPIWGGDPVRLQAEFALAAGDRLTLERSILPSQPVFVINQPAEQFRVVTVMLHDPLNRYGTVSVTLEASAGARRQNLVLDGSNSILQWSARRDKDGSSYRYRVRKVFKDASMVDEDWAEAAGSLLVVGDLDIRLETIQGFLLGVTDPLGALIHLAPVSAPPGIDVSQEIVLDAGQIAFTAALAFSRLAAREYTVSGQVFVASGTLEIPPHTDSSEVLLLSPSG